MTRPRPLPMDHDASLDRALGTWARHDAGDEAALMRILSHADAIAQTKPAPARHAPAEPGQGGPRRAFWMLGGAVAASVAIAALLAPSPRLASPMAGTGALDAQGLLMLAEADADSGLAFALLYTPTIEEEYQL